MSEGKENLTPFKPGHEKKGGMKKGYRSIKVALRKLSAAKIDWTQLIKEENLKIFKQISGKQDLTMADVIHCRMILDAASGDYNARKEYFKQISDNKDSKKLEIDLKASVSIIVDSDDKGTL